MADGYARASGRVGVAVATSGPGATNLTTGIATAMLDSVPTVFITGQVPSKLLGTDAFQETDVTGITLPITKHNYLVTDARELARTLREAFLVARSGRPGSRARGHLQGRAAGRRRSSSGRSGSTFPATRTSPRRGPRTCAGRSELIEKAERPLILAGHGVDPVRRLARCSRSSWTRRARPWPRPCSASAASRPAIRSRWDDGHARRGLRQHRDPEGRPPARLRHAVRRPRDRQPQDLRAQRQEDPRGDRRLRGGEERGGGRAPPCRPARDARGAPAHRRREQARGVAPADRRVAAGHALARHRPPAGHAAGSSPPTSSTTSGRPPTATP